MSKEQYVTFEVAQLLKEKGFDWECRAYWHEDDRELIEDWPMSLYDIWRYQIDMHRQGEYVKHIGNGGSTETGAPWLYAEDTDYFVKISCPKYDKDPIWAVRTVWGGWFTMDTTNWWQGGTLDVTGEIYADVINDWELNNGDISAYEDEKYD